MNKCTIIAFANQKGGVGKTTSAVNIASAVAENGKRVLLCDFDPQGNATSGVGADKHANNTIYDVLLGANPYEAVIKTTFERLDVLPASMNLAGAELEIADEEHREAKLKNALDMLRPDYDYIFIDCPPSLEMLTLNALCAADSILVPVQCEYYALEGLSDLMGTLRIVKKKLNPRLEIFAVALTMYDGRTNFCAQVAEEVRRHFPGKVFSAIVPRNIRLAEAPSHGLPVHAYDKFSRGAKAYESMAEEFLTKL